MKSSVPKTDKKKRKQLNLDVARLEAEMEQKHQQELEKLQESFPNIIIIDSVTEDLAKMNLENQPPGFSRAQRKRERRAALERARQESFAEVDMECLASFRQDEEEKLTGILEAKHLEMKALAKLCLTLWDPMDCSMLGSSVLHYLPEFVQIYACDEGEPINALESW